MSDNVVARLRELLDSTVDYELAAFIDGWERDGEDDSTVAVNFFALRRMLADLPALLDVVEAARVVVTAARDEFADDGIDELCMALGRVDGRSGHDWAGWSEPYETAGGGLSHIRVCNRCGQYEAEPVGGDACDSCDPGGCQCSVGRKDGE